LGEVVDGMVRVSPRATRIREPPAGWRWSRIRRRSLVDADNAVQNRLKLDVDRVTRLLRTEAWDLSLVGRCPVPVHTF